MTCWQICTFKSFIIIISYKTICTRHIPITSLIHVGLNDIVPENLLSIFDENELEVCTVCMYMD